VDILIGQKFGAWKVSRSAHIYKYRQQFECKCECGTERVVDGYNLVHGLSESCGCWNLKATSEAHLKHGDSRHGKRAAEYLAWCKMKTRCYNPKCQRYPSYGGRGISICDRWRNSYEAFLADMGRKPSPDHSLDRKNVNGNYEPGNCRWATDDEQRMNKRPRQKKAA
jgi:hypothetical protein